jgi:omega-hydroxy-beta-dihydromenaquinone-9 sulfotransferase
MTFYLDVRMWMRMVRLALRARNPKAKRRMLVLLVGVVPVVAVVHAICFFLDPIVFRRLRDVEVTAPVFITGHARSGTTLLHRLMSMAPGRFSVFRLYEMFLPSLIEKKILRALGSVDRRLLGSRIEAAVLRAEQRSTLSEAQDMHRTGLLQPEEDDFVLTCSLASGFWIVLAPYMRELDFYYVDERSPRARRRLMSFYKECVRRQLYLNGADRTHLSKNPTFTGRIESLIETFPDARFVVLMRDPRETIPSLLKLLQRTWHGGGWDDEAIDGSIRVLAEQSFHTYRYPLEVLDRHPDVPRAIVDYRDLVASPKRTIAEVYARLGLEMTPSFERVLDDEEQRDVHEKTYTYSLEEFGLRDDEIRTRLADLYERFGWPQPEETVTS